MTHYLKKVANYTTARVANTWQLDSARTLDERLLFPFLGVPNETWATCRTYGREGVASPKGTV